MPETITQGSTGPVAVVGKEDGPYWSAYGPSEAALSSYPFVYGTSAFLDRNVNQNFLRDSVERRNDVESLRQEICRQDARFVALEGRLTSLTAQIAAAETARLTAERDAAKQELMIQQIVNQVRQNGNGNGD